MIVFIIILLALLILCAIAVSFTKSLLNSILVFMAFSTIMSIIWILLQSPDLAITEAAVGAGVTTVLFLATLRRIKAIDREEIIEDETDDAALQGEDEASVETIEEGGASHEL